MRALVWDARLSRLQTVDPLRARAPRSSTPSWPATRGPAGCSATTSATSRRASEFDLQARLHVALARARSARTRLEQPARPWAFPSRDAWLAYLRDYVARARPDVLCDDQYDFVDGATASSSSRTSPGSRRSRARAGCRSGASCCWCSTGRSASSRPASWRGRSRSGSPTARAASATSRTGPRPRWGTSSTASRSSAATARTARCTTRCRAAQRALRALGETLARLTWLATEHAGSVSARGYRVRARRTGSPRSRAARRWDSSPTPTAGATCWWRTPTPPRRAPSCSRCRMRSASTRSPPRSTPGRRWRVRLARVARASPSRSPRGSARCCASAATSARCAPAPARRCWRGRVPRGAACA